MYFSVETYSSLGFGDLVPIGPVRMLAGVEALNGLLLIGWSASYAYIAMERFWTNDDRARVGGAIRNRAQLRSPLAARLRLQRSFTWPGSIERRTSSRKKK
jgi:hypothetical protein